MPTNILRHRNRAPGPAAKGVGQARRDGVPRRALLKAGRVAIRIELHNSPTADRIWQALPLHSTAETWGKSVHFEVPVETGRERGARINAAAGDVCFWTEDDRVIVAFGETPISGPGEVRLPRPCNVWATALDDVTLLKSVRPGEKVSLTAASD